jgi:hypothetical protein
MNKEAAHMPKTGETRFMYLNNGEWNFTTSPDYWRNQGFFVMEIYIVKASENHTAW